MPSRVHRQRETNTDLGIVYTTRHGTADLPCLKMGFIVPYLHVDGTNAVAVGGAGAIGRHGLMG